MTTANHRANLIERFRGRWSAKSRITIHSLGLVSRTPASYDGCRAANSVFPRFFSLREYVLDRSSFEPGTTLTGTSISLNRPDAAGLTRATAVSRAPANTTRLESPCGLFAQRSLAVTNNESTVRRALRFPSSRRSRRDLEIVAGDDWLQTPMVRGATSRNSPRLSAPSASRPIAEKRPPRLCRSAQAPRRLLLPARGGCRRPTRTPTWPAFSWSR